MRDGVIEHCKNYAGIMVNHITTVKGAIQASLACKTVSQGVIILDDSFARGTDFRFKKPSYVMIYSEDNYYQASMIEQMVGRSNRYGG